jgi:hypothetical protein
MAQTITLGDFVTALTFETGIDGQVTGSGRHPPLTWIYPLANRTYRELMSLVTQYNEDFFRTSTSPDALPDRLAGEDYIGVTYPPGASDIVGIDVLIGGSWYELTRASFAQRRIFPGANRPESPGEWSVIFMEEPAGGSSTNDGLIAIWPATLTGTFTIHYVPTWVEITDTADSFLIQPDWLEWMLCKAALPILQRDNNKKNTVEMVMARLNRAELKIINHARRHKRGIVVARRRDGMEL